MAKNKIEEYLLGIHINKELLKIIQIDKNKAEVSLIHIEDLAGEELTSKRLKKVLKSIKHSLKTKVCSIGFSSENSFLKWINIDGNPKDMRSIVNWEVEQQHNIESQNFTIDIIDENILPEAISQTSNMVEEVNNDEDTAIAIKVVEKEEETNSKQIFVAGLDSNELQNTINVIKKAGLKPIIADIDALAIINILQYNSESEGKHRIIIDCNKSAISIIVENNGKYIDSDQILLPEFSTDKKIKKTASRIENSIVELLESLEIESLDSIDEIYFCGDIVANLEMLNLLKTHLNFDSVILNPFDALTLETELRNNIIKLAPSLVTATGLALRILDEELVAI